MKVREIIKLLERDGWIPIAVRGSHRRFKHSLETSRVTVAGLYPDDLAPGTLNSILKQAALNKDR